MQMSVWKLAQSTLAGVGNIAQIAKICLVQTIWFQEVNTMVMSKNFFSEQAQFHTISKKASNRPLMPCSNAASSMAQTGFALY